ncbi:MAG: endolytic transglycosylase MltG [Clostridia bacterium]|nr:endolytic transglycosylase MltG [Clostridia bacterium]
MTKRIIALLLVFSFIFSFSACKGDETIETTTENTTESTTENTTESTTESTTQVPTVKVTIPEGYTLVKISWLLEEKGFCTSKEFIDACQSYKDWLDLSEYPFLNDLHNAKNVCFYLEGYFFPLTYDIPENATAKDIIKMFLNGTKQKFNDTFMMSVRNSGFNLHQLLTLASLIEKEAFLPEHRPMISSVLHNRLDKNMKFQCDPTVKYCTGVIEYIYPDQIDHFKYYYNTYRCDGLMAGPICNPGMASIEAALNPADTNYLYFIIGTVEPYEAKYSETYAEHSKFWNENKDRLTGGGA